MIRENWQEYIESHIDINLPFRKRGYVAADNLENFVENGVTLVDTIKGVTGLKSLQGLTILDIGCANGRLPIALDVLEEAVDLYIGVDIMEKPITFLREAFKGYSNHFFYHMYLHNQRYASRQSGSVSEVDFTDLMIPEEGYDLIVLNSVFTHLGRPYNAEAYLRNIVKVLTAKTLLYITWFKNPPNEISFDEKRTVYTEGYIRSLYDHAGLEILNDANGKSTRKRDQWKIVARRK